MHHHHATHLIAAALLGLPPLAAAAERPFEMLKLLVACVDCDLSQFEQRVQSMSGDWHLGDLVVHVGEPRKNQLEAHRLHCATWTEPPPAPVVDPQRPPSGPVKARCARIESVPAPVDPAVAGKFAFWREWFVATDGSLKKTIEVDAAEIDGPWARVVRDLDGFGYARNLNARGLVAGDLARGCTACPAEVQRFIANAESTLIGPTPEVRATVRLADGATVDMQLTTVTGRFEEVEGSLRMADGQPIPRLGKSPIEGAWRFAPERAAVAETFVDYLRSLGSVEVVATTAGPIAEVVCVATDGPDKSRCEAGRAGG